MFSLLLFLLVPLVAQQAFAQQGDEQRKIQYLIGAIAELKDATFVRNGVEYDAKQAADHLRRKLRNAGDRVVTADDFIVYCATGSSMSGQRYRIRFRDGRLLDAAAYLRAKLAAYPKREPALPWSQGD